MPRKKTSDAFVAHPRYGDEPHLTGLNPEENWLTGEVYLHWHSGGKARIPNTAIAANTARQNRPTIAVTHYFDSRRSCVDCGQSFLFFAAEQKYWYEVLGFPLEANCVRCVPCRKQQRTLQAQRQRYEELVVLEDRTADQDIALIESALALVGASVFGRRLLERLRSILKRAAPHRKLEGLWRRLREIEESGTR